MNLADPELELIDPTPNVHSMFLHFDKTFFWEKLSSRCLVRWSKRMYSCAGICSYEGGRNGLCDIALSEPLLKLRPRKDLVETLLHEMIHAFLFITRKDQNRDGHGPNFQAHMHRINRAAGLNISIYHDFHDEVKLYQTHWWRCDGPCQTRRPHFGIVRRSCNRAPGPSDYWWNSHKRNCGGTFIKIKEPEKPEIVGKETKSKKNKESKPNGDITKYINSNNNNKEVTNKNIVQNKNPKKPILKDSSNIPVKPNVGIKTNNSSTLVITKKNVIFNPQITKPKPVVFSVTGQTISGERKRTSASDVVETVRNVWANKQLGTNNNGKLNTNSNPSTSVKPSKHKVDTDLKSPPTKIKKIDDYFKTTASSILKDIYGQDFNVTQSKNNEKLVAVVKDPRKNEFDTVSCPVCNIKIDANKINRHLDECLNKSVINDLSKDLHKGQEGTISNNKNDRTTMKEIIATSPLKFKKDEPFTKVKKEPIQTIDEIIATSSLKFMKDEPLKVKKEPIETIDLSNIEFVIGVNSQRSRTSFDHSDKVKTEHKQSKTKHKDLRKSDSFIVPTNSNIARINDLKRVEPLIDQPIKVLEPSCSKSDPDSQKECPCCGDKLNTTVDEHLEDCLSFFENNTTIPEEGASTSFSNETIVIDDDDDKFDETLTMNATGTKLPCPCCLKMVEEIDMNNHLDICLS